MFNRQGEFALVIDPGDEGHTVSRRIVNTLLDQLEKVLHAGLQVHSAERVLPLELYLTASPEAGSIRFWLVAGTGLAVAANLTQVAGVSVADVIQAIGHRAPPSSHAHLSETAARIAQDEQFMKTVDRLVRTASESGYDSVRIEVGEVRIELVERVPNDLAASIEDLKDRIERLEQELTKLGPAPPFVEGVRSVDQTRFQITTELSALQGQLSAFEGLREREMRRPRSQRRPR